LTPLLEAIDHGWLVKFVEHRIADKRVIRHIKKWLNAGVLEDGKRTYQETGTPQVKSRGSRLAIRRLQMALQRQIAATDQQIDQLVYELYGLTHEEIKIVEEAIC
jgi:retron-type reverse transcriptase